ncbi:DgyrCDS9680 [Dimorphilus gyrociliatus]|uniref:DgyrCDS9680 n=1 Tax=Dimorphilus gyrociliatus TaxID=2664684 RepID=A0A7I8VY23_9ANNE|nr:DgyrCDS9680 [Dimorphilus gyrociliatus]
MDSSTTSSSDFLTKTTNTLAWPDYLIFSLTLLVSLGIGIYTAVAGGGQKTTNEYLMGNRNMKVVPVSLSMFMSFVSAILVLGNTGEMYQRGTMYWLQCVANSISYVTIGMVFVPLFFPLNVTSSFEYLERRYKHKSVKIVGTIYLMLSQIIYMGIAMYSPATALEAVTNFPVWASILASGIVATIYTTIGGMKAVIWTDVFQGIVYMVGVSAILGFGVEKVGGLKKVWDISREHNRLVDFGSWDTWTFNPAIRLSIWSVMIGSFVNSHQTSGTGQTSVQRYCALPTLRGAKLSVLLNAPAICLMFSITCLIGLTVFAYYNGVVQCDPLSANFIKNPNQLLPYFIMDAINRKGLPGLFLAVLFSGALSTVSSSLSALSAVAWKDLLEWRFKHIPESRKALVTKFLAAFFGCVAIGMAFLASKMGNVLQASQSFVTGVAGPLLGMFVLGAVFPCANWKGATIGSIFGLGITMWITIGAYITKPYSLTLPVVTDRCLNYTPPAFPPTNPPNVLGIYKISYLWYATVGTLTTIIVGLAVSFATGPTNPRSVHRKYIIAIVDQCYCCLPESFKKLFRCWEPSEAIDEDEITEEIELKDSKIVTSKKDSQVAPLPDYSATETEAHQRVGYKVEDNPTKY